MTETRSLADRPVLSFDLCQFELVSDFAIRISDFPQRSLYASEDALVQSTRTVSTNLVALYKGLGGGWPIEE